MHLRVKILVCNSFFVIFLGGAFSTGQAVPVSQTGTKRPLCPVLNASLAVLVKKDICLFH
jgi:hypothetical protein